MVISYGRVWYASAPAGHAHMLYDAAKTMAPQQGNIQINALAKSSCN